MLEPQSTRHADPSVFSSASSSVLLGAGQPPGGCLRAAARDRAAGKRGLPLSRPAPPAAFFGVTFLLLGKRTTCSIA